MWTWKFWSWRKHWWLHKPLHMLWAWSTSESWAVFVLHTIWGYKHLHGVIWYEKSSHATFRSFVHVYIQRVVTKMVPSIRDLSYEERLAGLQLPMLKKGEEGKAWLQYIKHKKKRRRWTSVTWSVMHKILEGMERCWKECL